MKVVLLAGGISKRLWPLTIDKNLWPFPNGNLISHNLKTLKECGLTDIIVVVNPHSKEAVQHLAKEIELDIKIIVQDEAGGMGKAVLLTSGEIAGSNVLVLNGDDIVESSLIAAVKDKASSQSSDMILVGKKYPSYFDGGYLQVEDTKAVMVVEKPGEGKQPSDLIKLMVDYFADGKDLLEALQSVTTDRDDLYEVAVNELLKLKSSFVISYEGVWLTVKYPWHLLTVLAYFLSHIKEPQISEEADISPRAVIDGPVIIEKGVKIFENAKVRGPAYIGKNVVIANNALVRESYIGENSVVGFGSEVARSYFGPDCWTHNNFVGDSVLQANVSFGVGTVLTNLKLDESDIYSVIKGIKVNTGMSKFGAVIGENVRVGSNTTIMPGVKIGSGCFIGAGALVKEDLEAGQFLQVVQDQVKKANNKAHHTTSRDKFKGKI